MNMHEYANLINYANQHPVNIRNSHINYIASIWDFYINLHHNLLNNVLCYRSNNTFIHH